MEDETAPIVEALEAAEESARRVLVRELGAEASRFAITVRADYDDKGILRLVIDIEASRPRCTWISQVVSRAVREARRAFEEMIIGVPRGPKNARQG